ncbi:MarR family transcriptional regulator [Brucella sp. BO3]|uniref:MarR family transcriptional regulator n=1 Tax=Brucella inopinata TaxID=1218315 RepID=A0AAW7BBX7_9HYPH|nr:MULTISPECIES: MarR family transcriptional regulator [Brucella]KEY04577.1 AsnC family transcriptional regulator [Brucella suis bv. 4 str. 40]EFM55458.1 MarR family transcriptional regulator [Brucella inopinata BO1]MDL2334205.1 MarR family transcriptional regulator [Brucella inopinata]OEI84559.1 AsnC family transcriptional regulator [Brucella sp. B13-0095]QMV27960.1 MarR family transcriptional regulator [Brucella sp. BO3]
MKQAWVEFAPLLASAARGWRKAFDAAMAEHGLSDAKAIPLITLLRHGDCIPQGVLAERVGIEGATIVRIVDELEKDGLIQRIVDDADRRVKLIQLTEDGRAVATQVEKSAARLRAQFLGGFDSQEVDVAMEVLRKLNEKFQNQPS